jgi:hypothetical protein
MAVGMPVLVFGVIGGGSAVSSDLPLPRDLMSALLCTIAGFGAFGLLALAGHLARAVAEAGAPTFLQIAGSSWTLHVPRDVTDPESPYVTLRLPDGAPGFRPDIVDGVQLQHQGTTLRLPAHFQALPKGSLGRLGSYREPAQRSFAAPANPQPEGPTFALALENGLLRLRPTAQSTEDSPTEVRVRTAAPDAFQQQVGSQPLDGVLRELDEDLVYGDDHEGLGNCNTAFLTVSETPIAIAHRSGRVGVGSSVPRGRYYYFAVCTDVAKELELSITPQDTVVDAAQELGFHKDLQVGDADFDGRFLIKGDETAADALKDATIRQAAPLMVKDGQAETRLDTNSHPDRIRQAIEGLVALRRTLPPNKLRPSAESLDEK